MKLEFRIDCVPPTATAQQKGAFIAGKSIRFYKKKNIVRAEQFLFAALVRHVPKTPLRGPLRLEVIWSFPWRKSEPKRNRLDGSRWCDTRPDLSNLVKILEDTMTFMRFWNDDGQIADLRIQKQWGDWTGIAIKVEEIEGVLI